MPRGFFEEGLVLEPEAGEPAETETTEETDDTRCTNCKKALKWLDDNGITYALTNIKDDHPDEETLRKYHALSGLGFEQYQDDLKAIINIRRQRFTTISYGRP